MFTVDGVDPVSRVNFPMGRETWREVGGVDGRGLVREDLEFVEVGVAEELAQDGVVKAVNDAVVLVAPLVCTAGKKISN